MSKSPAWGSTEIMRAAGCCYNTAVKYMKLNGVEFHRGEHAAVGAQDAKRIVKAINEAQAAKLSAAARSKKK